VRQRWFGATGTRVPEIAIDGDPLVPVSDALVLEDVSDDDQLRKAHAEGKPVVVRADTAENILTALKRPEVAAVLVPESKSELLDIDLRELTYG
jgi:hypothetical protein